MEGLSDKRKATFRKQVIKLTDKHNHLFELVANPESPVPLPMLIIRKRDRIDLVLSRIITKIYSVLTNFYNPSL